ncbi:pectinesterase/pectinesterase inhibitor U1-like [Salvia splendens]|uniref:pectinesterase/pectinesterase inhibitor U1-like n=1 Tax=Salvia splendens TaxID=180675 RepID=UPI001C256874|nr:pectinesterase/pectinesterase inhibitor U1-like [Salvia splendens]
MTVTAVQKAQLYNLLSAALTNVDTCIDGFSHSQSDKKVQADILINDWMGLNSTVSDLLSAMDNILKVKETETVPPDGEEWPECLSAEDRVLLEQQPRVVHVMVALDKTGKYMTVSEAVKNAPVKSSERYVIRIKEGKYKENVVIPKNMTNLVFIGDGYDKTFIIASKNVVDGDTTFSSATVDFDYRVMP